MRPRLTAPFRTPLRAFPLPSCLGLGLGKAPQWPGTLGTWEPSSDSWALPGPPLLLNTRPLIEMWVEKAIL